MKAPWQKRGNRECEHWRDIFLSVEVPKRKAHVRFAWKDSSGRDSEIMRVSLDWLVTQRDDTFG